MTPDQRNDLNYLLYAIVGATIAAGLHLSMLLAGVDPIAWRPLAATFTSTLFGTLATAYGASKLPRAGRAEVSALVSEVGVDRARTILADRANLPPRG